jgi:hypothetical protein
MSEKLTSTRRAFFLRSGAALGTGVAAAVASSATAAPRDRTPDGELQKLRQELDAEQDRQAIRRLHRDFATLLEQQAYERAAELFHERGQLDLSGVRASGKPAIQQLFDQQYRARQASPLHAAYRQNASQQSRDLLTLSEDGRQASATFHVEVHLLTPLEPDCTAAEMARLQGGVADRRWEAGRLEAQYMKGAGGWKIASLRYSPGPP